MLSGVCAPVTEDPMTGFIRPDVLTDTLDFASFNGFAIERGEFYLWQADRPHVCTTQTVRFGKN